MKWFHRVQDYLTTRTFQMSLVLSHGKIHFQSFIKQHHFDINTQFSGMNLA